MFAHSRRLMMRFGKGQAVRIGNRGLAVFVGCLLMAGAPAMAGPGGFYTIDVEMLGTNAILDGNGGSLYIPQMSGTSGELGDPPPGSSKRIGLDKDASPDQMQEKAKGAPCPKCGKTDSTLACFCPKCGKPFAVPETLAELDGSRCPHCGEKPWQR